MKADKTGEYVEIPVGAVSNFASVPKLLQTVFRPDLEDVKMAAFFHDLMVAEFGQQAFIMEDRNGIETIVRKPDWNESAHWFRAMIQVRQRQTRKHHGRFRKAICAGFDFGFRWTCYGTVKAYGVVR